MAQVEGGQLMVGFDFSREGIASASGLVLEGTYGATVVDVTDNISKAGNSYMRLTWRLDDGQQVEDVCLYQADVHSPMLRMGLAKIAATLEAGDRPLRHPDGRSIAKALVGVRAAIDVVHQTDQHGQLRTEVREVRQIIDDDRVTLAIDEDQ
jgi:hypothetical protein